MDEEIDELFYNLFSIEPTESAKNVTKSLVTLNYLLPGVFQLALDLIELHKVIVKDNLVKGNKLDNEGLSGIFTKHVCVIWEGKELWTVQPAVKRKKGAYTPSPLQGTAWGYVVDLERWHCSCQEFTKSRYTSSGEFCDVYKDSRSGWGGLGLADTGRVPTCVHLLAIFLFTRGTCLFTWMDKQQAEERFEVVATGDAAGNEEAYATKTMESVEDWCALCS